MSDVKQLYLSIKLLFRFTQSTQCKKDLDKLNQLNFL